MNDVEVVQVAGMATRLIHNPSISQRIASGYKWKLETVIRLAWDARLGWYDDKAAFIYDTGVKLRWKDDGQGKSEWLFGAPSLWRGCHLGNPTFRRVVLCETEADAISVINSGIERNGTLGIALPSRSEFDPSWAELFAGKEVMLAFETDAVGEETTQRVMELLTPHAQSIRALTREEVLECL